MIQSMVKKRQKARKGFLVLTHTYKRGNNFQLLTFPQREQLTRCASPCTHPTQLSVALGTTGVGNPVIQCKPKPGGRKQRGDNPVAVTSLMDDDLMGRKRSKGTRLRPRWSSFPRGSTPSFLGRTCRTTVFSFSTWLSCWPGTGCAGSSWWFLRWTSCSPHKPPLCSSPPLILWETLRATYPQTWTLRSTCSAGNGGDW